MHSILTGAFKPVHYLYIIDHHQLTVGRPNPPSAQLLDIGHVIAVAAE